MGLDDGCRRFPKKLPLWVIEALVVLRMQHTYLAPGSPFSRRNTWKKAIFGLKTLGPFCTDRVGVSNLNCYWNLTFSFARHSSPWCTLGGSRTPPSTPRARPSPRQCSGWCSWGWTCHRDPPRSGWTETGNSPMSLTSGLDQRLLTLMPYILYSDLLFSSWYLACLKFQPKSSRIRNP